MTLIRIVQSGGRRVRMVLSMRCMARNSYVSVMTVTIERDRLLNDTPVAERRIELAGMS